MCQLLKPYGVTNEEVENLEEEENRRRPYQFQSPAHIRVLKVSTLFLLLSVAVIVQQAVINKRTNLFHKNLTKLISPEREKKVQQTLKTILLAKLFRNHLTFEISINLCIK